jgi:tetratricopeptide (TPR) repeat protein
LYSISIIIVFVIARFRLPALAVLTIPAAYAVHEIGRGLAEALHAAGKERLRRATTPAMLLLAVIALTAALRTRNPDRLIRWSDYYNLAGAYQERDRFEEALDAYERALELNPDSSSARAGKAAMESRVGRTPGAVESQSSSMLSAPDGHRATTSRMADSEAAFSSATI